MKKATVLLSVLLALLAFPLYSQEEFPGDTADRLFVIADFDFDITGRTRPYALIYYGELTRGEIIQGEASLEEYIREKTQILTNHRVLKDTVEITHSIGEQEADGTYPVVLHIKVEDTWNIIALPRPRYSTNTGFELILNARDFNFLGTMNPLRVNLGYAFDEDRNNSVFFEVLSTTLFRAYGYNWFVRFDNLFEYRPQADEPFFYRNVTGLSMELPFRNTTFTFGFDESFTLNEENQDRYKEDHGEFQSGLYMSTRMFTVWDIPTGLHVSRFGELTYTPNISAVFNHELGDWTLHDIRRGPFLNFGHSLGFEKVNWIANFREGLDVSIRNSYTYDFYRLKNDGDPLSINLTISGIGHVILSDFFAVSTRLQYRHWFNEPGYHDRAGDNLRGIADRALQAEYMISLNMDFPFRVLLFTPSEWLNSQRYRFFDFEFQISPVIDMAFYHDPERISNDPYNSRNFAASGGLEFMVFPTFFRSLYVRLSFGWDLRELFEARPLRLPAGHGREVTFIMRHFF